MIRFIRKSKKLTLNLILLLLSSCMILYSLHITGIQQIYPGSGSLEDLEKKSLPDSSLQSRKLPQAIILGVGKCGTAALRNMLSLSPFIVHTRGEPEFFTENYEKGIEWYRERMPFSYENQITIEKSPGYYAMEAAPKRIKAMNKNIKLILIVREPALRVPSTFLERRKRKTIIDMNSTFEKAIFDMDGNVKEVSEVLYYRYSDYASMWVREFPPNQLHIVDGDLLVTDPYSEVKKVESFLELPPRLKPGHFKYDKDKGFYCLVTPYGLNCLDQTKGREHPYLSPKQLSKLRKYFAPFNEQFYKMTGRDFSWPTM